MGTVTFLAWEIFYSGDGGMRRDIIEDFQTDIECTFVDINVNPPYIVIKVPSPSSVKSSKTSCESLPVKRTSETQNSFIFKS